MKKILYSLLAVVLITGCFGGDAEETTDNNNEVEQPTSNVGRTINVPEDYSTITAAIESAKSGDKIVVAVGIYNEDINFNGKDIELTSTNPQNKQIVEATVIAGTGNGPVVRIDSGETAAAILSGFTITSGEYTEGGGLLIASLMYKTSPTITYNIFNNNSASNGGAIYVHISEAIIENNTFMSNVVTNSGGAIYVGSDADVIIRNNTFVQNEAASFGGAIHIVMSSPTIENNDFNMNQSYWAGGAISIGSDANPIKNNNTFSDNIPDDVN